MLAIKWGGYLAATATIVITAENLFAYSLYEKGGLLSWQKLAPFSRLTRKRSLNKVLSIILSSSGYKLLLYLRLVAAILWIVFPFDGLLSTLLVGYVLVSLGLANYRHFPYAITGGDRMLIVVFCAFFLLSFYPASAKVQLGTMVFLVGQLCLAYFTAGFSKLKSSHWKGGGASHFEQPTLLPEGPLKRWLTSNVKVPGMLVILWQLTFPVSLLLGPEVALAWLVTGLLFHLFNALVLGLNTFLFSWLAIYPLAYHVSTLIRAAFWN